MFIYLCCLSDGDWESRIGVQRIGKERGTTGSLYVVQKRAFPQGSGVCLYQWP